jgi:hypothetical protein
MRVPAGCGAASASVTCFNSRAAGDLSTVLGAKLCTRAVRLCVASPIQSHARAEHELSTAGSGQRCPLSIAEHSGNRTWLRLAYAASGAHVSRASWRMPGPRWWPMCWKPNTGCQGGLVVAGSPGVAVVDQVGELTAPDMAGESGTALGRASR